MRMVNLDDDRPHEIVIRTAEGSGWRQARHHEGLSRAVAFARLTALLVAHPDAEVTEQSTPRHVTITVTIRLDC